MSEQNTLPTYISVQEAAKHLGLSVDTVRELAANGQINALRVGRKKSYAVAKDGKAARVKYKIHKSALEGVE